MQFIYTLLFMIALIVWIVIGLDGRQDAHELDKAIVASHMSTWHFGAVERCSKSTCAPGVIDPRSFMPQTLTSGSAFDADRFRTQYDAASKTLVTYATPDMPTISGVSYKVAFSGLNDQADGESTMIGVFDRASGRADFRAVSGLHGADFEALPPGIAAVVPDGSPVIITHL